MINRDRMKIETGLYGLAFVLALAIRFVNLGGLALTNNEANLALQALEVARNTRPVIDAQPGYILLTGALFFLTQASELAARFWPAVVGSLIVWAPFLFKKLLGRTAAIILAFALAFDPGLVALSRQAGGEGFGIVFMLLGLGLLWNRRYLMAGICSGLALLGGVGLWFGIVPFVMAAGWTSFLTLPSEPAESAGAEDALQEDEPLVLTVRWRPFLFGLGGALLLVGTLFFTVPYGISASISAIPQYLTGWTRSNGVPVGLILMTLLNYELLPLILGVFCMLRSFFIGRPVDSFLSRWAFLAVVFTVIYPAHLVVYLVWAAVPLWALTTRFLSETLELDTEEPLTQIGYMALLSIPLFLSWYNYINFTINNVAGQELQNRLIIVIGALVMVSLIVILVWWGWGSRRAFTGLIATVTLLLSLYTLSMSWNAAGLGRNPLVESWWKSPPVAQAQLLTRTLDDLEQWNSVRNRGIDLVVAGVDSPALQWTLRDVPGVEFKQSLSPGQSPALLITASDQNLQLSADYTGQDFTWEAQPSWSLLLSKEWAQWMTARKAPLQNNSLILWVRSDMMPGGSQESGQ